MYMVCIYGATANNQLTINPPKDRKMPSLGSWPAPIIAFQDAYVLAVLRLGKLPKRLESQVKVNQRGLCILQRWGQLFCLAHTNKPCTCSGDVKVGACQIAFLFSIALWLMNNNLLNKITSFICLKLFIPTITSLCNIFFIYNDKLLLLMQN